MRPPRRLHRPAQGRRQCKPAGGPLWNRGDAAEAARNRHQSLVSKQQTLGELRDTDVAAAAVQLSQITLQQQAALSVRAKVSQLSLFDFLA
jgi:flagellin-like hook-associated protein FlgL